MLPPPRLLPLLVLLLSCADGVDSADTGGDLDQDGDGVVAALDCDDLDATAFPDAPELCDGVDNDCNGQIDDAPQDGEQAWPDQDGDGFGDQSAGALRCALTDGWIAQGGDCDDADSAVHPNAAEVCNDIDDDCDGVLDDGDLSLDSASETRFFHDIDRDGYGDERYDWWGCDAPPGYTEIDGDCDDADSTVHPGAEELCDDIDQDCDGSLTPCTG